MRTSGRCKPPCCIARNYSLRVLASCLFRAPPPAHALTLWRLYALTLPHASGSNEHTRSYVYVCETAAEIDRDEGRDIGDSKRSLAMNSCRSNS